MINDLATEATTVHSRFPHAVVAFLVALPASCLVGSRRTAVIETLERLARRTGVQSPDYMAEAITLVLWNADGTMDANYPPSNSTLRIEKFSELVEQAYWSRYKGLPPHTE